MTMTNPVADMLLRVCSVDNTYHDSVLMSSFELKANITEILKSEGYITDYAVKGAKVDKTLTLSLKYGLSYGRSVAGVHHVSKLGLRVYIKSTNLPKVLGGLSVAIISTPQGLLTGRQACEKRVGGEVLTYVW